MLGLTLLVCRTSIFLAHRWATDLSRFDAPVFATSPPGNSNQRLL